MLAKPFAMKLARNLELDGAAAAHEYRELAKTLAKETGQNPPDG